MKKIKFIDFDGDIFDWYKSLMDSEKQTLDPTKIKVSNELWNWFYKKTLSIYKEKENIDEASFGMFFINYAPSVKDSLKFDEVLLLEGWVIDD